MLSAVYNPIFYGRGVTNMDTMWTGEKDAMTCRELWIHALREENCLRANAAAWRLTLEQVPGDAERSAVRSLLRALEYAAETAGRTQRALCQLYRREEV